MRVYLEKEVLNNKVMYLPEYKKKARIISPDIEIPPEEILTKVNLFPIAPGKYIGYFRLGIRSRGKKEAHSRKTDSIKVTDVRGRARSTLKSILEEALKWEKAKFSDNLVYFPETGEETSFDEYCVQVKILLVHYNELYGQIWDNAESIVPPEKGKYAIPRR